MRYLLDPGPDSADYGAKSRSEWLDVDWSPYRHRMEIRGGEVEYVDMGEGDPILFVHGLGGCWQTWLENIPFFSRTHRVIAMDLPGFGASDLAKEEVSIEWYGEVLEEMCSRLGIEQAAVVGNSMGGFIGAELAIKHPDRVERLVLVSAAVFWQEYRRAKPLLSLARVSDAVLGRAIVGSTPLITRRPRSRAIALSFAGFRYPHLIPRELQVELLLTARRTRGFLPALEALGTYPLRDELPRIKCPTLVVWGTDDTLVGVKHADELEELIPSAQKVIFERTGHVPMLERPDRFNRVMAEFMEQTGEADDRAVADAARARDRDASTA